MLVGLGYRAVLGLEGGPKFRGRNSAIRLVEELHALVAIRIRWSEKARTPLCYLRALTLRRPLKSGLQTRLRTRAGH